VEVENKPPATDAIMIDGTTVAHSLKPKPKTSFGEYANQVFLRK
jgi:hypothetical protein